MRVCLLFEEERGPVARVTITAVLTLVRDLGDGTGERSVECHSDVTFSTIVSLALYLFCFFFFIPPLCPLLPISILCLSLFFHSPFSPSPPALTSSPLLSLHCYISRSLSRSLFISPSLSSFLSHSVSSSLHRYPSLSLLLSLLISPSLSLSLSPSLSLVPLLPGSLWFSPAKRCRGIEAVAEAGVCSALLCSALL